jgi:hypothetical protein
MYDPGSKKYLNKISENETLLSHSSFNSHGHHLHGENEQDRLQNLQSQQTPWKHLPKCGRSKLYLQYQFL